MLNRRTFVKVGSVAAGASLASRCAPSAAAPSAEQGGGARPAEPPSISALVSMQGQATPISAEERRGRVDKARRLMAEHKIDALMLTGGTSMVYFSGIQWGLSERLFSLVIPRTGEPFVVCPAFEEDRAREQFAASPFTGTADEFTSTHTRIRTRTIAKRSPKRLTTAFPDRHARSWSASSTGLPAAPR